MLNRNCGERPVRRLLPILLLSAVLSSCAQEEKAPPDGLNTREGSEALAHQLADCSVTYTVQAELIAKNSEADYRRYRDLAREAYVAATVALARDWNARKQRPLKFYVGVIDSWVDAKYQWWLDALEGTRESGGTETLMLLDVYHSPEMAKCDRLQELQRRLAASEDVGDL